MVILNVFKIMSGGPRLGWTSLQKGKLVSVEERKGGTALLRVHNLD